MPAPLDLTGQIFGRLYVIRKDINRSNSGRVRWECKCACDNVISITTGDLRSGATQSCGCLQKEKTRLANVKHGAKFVNAQHPLYKIWTNIKDRCHNTNSPSFKYYGERGIIVCDAWRNDYAAFRDYMLAQPNCPTDTQTPGTKLDREIDRYPNNNGPYAPGNVRWATRQEQMRNTRFNKIIRVNGVRMSLKDAVDKYGRASYMATYHRIAAGWSLRDAFLTPAQKRC